MSHHAERIEPLIRHNAVNDIPYTHFPTDSTGMQNMRKSYKNEANT